MAEEIKRQIDLLRSAKSPLEQAVPLIVTSGRIGEAVQSINQAANQLEQLSFDSNFGQLSTNMKILANSGSSILSTVSFQAYIVDILEMVTSLLDQFQNSGPPQQSDALKYMHVGEYLIKLSSRVTTRYKLNVLFEPEYEAKSLRAFMVVKELSGVVKFLNLAPDISENQQANLDNGLEIDCLSQESPDELHKLAGSVLEVQSVQIFRETKAQPTQMLDPPTSGGSFDSKVNDFLNK